MPGPLIVSLLPARNAAPDLPAHLESVARFADAVVALDDGSTDDTRSILESHPLVRVLLTNPPRAGFAGWDDAANRNRLLAAAIDLGAQWALSLDADELLAPEDAAALRAFVTDGADPEDAYTVAVYRMVGDLEHYDDDALRVGRLFAPRPGQVFPDARLHFVALPTSIPRERWRDTTLRVQHRAGMTADRRAARYEKYQEADPDRTWQSSYEHLLEEPRVVQEWWPRGRLLPVFANTPVIDDRPLGPDECALSVIVISRDDADVIERAVGAVARQEVDAPFEVIVVTSGTDRTAAIVRERFPGVSVVELDHPALPGEARNAGWRASRGRYVTFPGSHVELQPGSLQARLDAHRRGWPMVSETMENGTRTWAGWASYFLDNSSVLPGRPSFDFEAAPLRCSYHRDLLEEIGGFPEDMRTAEDTIVNNALFDRGYGARRERTVVVRHHSPCRTPARLVRHHFHRGRGMGRMLAEQPRSGSVRSRPLLRYLVRSGPGRVRWIHRRVQQWGGGLRLRYWWSLPLIVVGAVATWAGCASEIVRRAPLSTVLGVPRSWRRP